MKEDIRSGFISNLPVAVSVMAYGSVLGMLAAQKNIQWTELMFMNVFVFAGTAQFVMVEMWKNSLPVIEITIAVLVINLRYVLIGASLRTLFEGKALKHKMAVMHLVADENWAVTMAALKSGKANTYFLLGGGLCLLTSWCFGTLLGHSLGAVIKNPEAYALDFAFVAVFTALAFSMWQGKRNVVPWIAAAVFAVAAEKMLPGKWYVLIGGMGGAAVEAFLWGKGDNTNDR
ncbi:MAG: AzlC family ABC transporter permease [Desulfobacteraceae bacterium]|nr:AzlC family ABC transporter permease [Desulfobacteraceae bacterium]MCB9494998.1 AzlC family ABC transporter permease [Desulfobacteraceae bacterium]